MDTSSNWRTTRGVDRYPPPNYLSLEIGSRTLSSRSKSGELTWDESPAHHAVTPARAFVLLLLLLVLVGCATPHDLQAPKEASKREPTNAEIQIDYLRQRNIEVNALLDEADR